VAFHGQRIKTKPHYTRILRYKIPDLDTLNERYMREGREAVISNRAHALLLFRAFGGSRKSNLECVGE